MQVRVIGARSIAFKALYNRTKNLLHSTNFIFEIYGLWAFCRCLSQV